MLKTHQEPPKTPRDTRPFADRVTLASMRALALTIALGIGGCGGQQDLPTDADPSVTWALDVPHVSAPIENRWGCVQDVDRPGNSVSLF